MEKGSETSLQQARQSMHDLELAEVDVVSPNKSDVLRRTNNDDAQMCSQRKVFSEDAYSGHRESHEGIACK
jgi:hypothetical protein